MSPYRYAICIVEAGQPYDTNRVNFDSSDLAVSDVTWSSPTRLTIRHSPKRISTSSPCGQTTQVVQRIASLNWTSTSRLMKKNAKP